MLLKLQCLQALSSSRKLLVFGVQAAFVPLLGVWPGRFSMTLVPRSMHP